MIAVGATPERLVLVVLEFVGLDSRSLLGWARSPIRLVDRLLHLLDLTELALEGVAAFRARRSDG